ncbi:MAG: zinc ribbon domain-containing protein [Actinobacteria bacterium]|nr:zinc ribbon domain-containing protein [Actinomycetota bacterium]MBU4160283.1 zinc ribbon domain-containing protein [Actinomycetota bacterium]MBU4249981.1 zinc ribbon domain-containing protein [Actinomycetota bacterium]
MDCPQCQSAVPEVAHFCHRCGQDLVPGAERANRRFALAPNEPVASFALISSIMPREAGRHPQTYRTALTITLVAALLAAVLGAMPIALLIAAFAIPVVYITYLYDVNMWEDAPVAVTGLGFLLTGVLAALFTLAWLNWMPFNSAVGGTDGIVAAMPTLTGFLVAAVAVPVVGELIRQVGPLVLASRPAFDDLMDGLTFGVISGVAYASFDTLVRHWDLLTGGMVVGQPTQLASLVFLEGFVKPLVMGTATGLAVAEFSGLGKGYDGFTGRYFGGLLLAIVANILFSGGVYLLGFVGTPSLSLVLQVLWGLLVLGLLILRLRTVLQTALLEGALEAASRAEDAEQGDALGFCPRCEMPLLPGAAFCSACGQSARGRSKVSAGSSAVEAPPKSGGAKPSSTGSATSEEGEK